MNFTKSLLTIALSLLILSCNKNIKESTTESTKITTTTSTTSTTEKETIEKVEKVSKMDFLTDVTSLTKTKSPIKNLIAFAKTNASKVISINKDNINASLLGAKAYKYAIIIVGVHTAIKIMDLNNCKSSGSWGACMPMGEGYIKLGTLNYKKDYINNVIGLPDTQERMLYLFN